MEGGGNSDLVRSNFSYQSNQMDLAIAELKLPVDADFVAQNACSSTTVSCCGVLVRLQGLKSLLVKVTSYRGLLESLAR